MTHDPLNSGKHSPAAPEGPAAERGPYLALLALLAGLTVLFALLLSELFRALVRW